MLSAARSGYVEYFLGSALCDTAKSLLTSPRWMLAVTRWCPGKAEEEPIAELSATTTTPPGCRMGADPRRHGASQQTLNEKERPDMRGVTWL